MICFNDKLADELNIQFKHLSEQQLADYFSGNTLFTEEDPIAMAYAGHQFGSFVSQLGDGRAVMLGEIITPDKTPYSIQLKGSGRTRFSRGGDGKSALGPVIREYIVSEAMHSLGVPTTRALAMVTTGDMVWRQTGNLPGGILTRAASGFIRIGTFEYFYAREDTDALKQLADYAIARHYPKAAQADNPYLAFFEMICKKQAALVPKWMNIGFIHGVMNTDNTAISGETIDYGPCAFMDHYDPNTVFSSIDMHGRYRFINQGSILAWNMSSFGNCLLSFFHEDEEQAKILYHQILENLQRDFLSNWRTGMAKKLGLTASEEDDADLLSSFLDILQKQETDYTLAFRYLSDHTSQPSSLRFQKLFTDFVPIQQWLERWQQRLKKEEVSLGEISSRMNGVNPAFIPRNHRIEKAIQLAENNGNFEETFRLIKILNNPYEEQPEFSDYMKPPEPEERVLQTFCGT